MEDFRFRAIDERNQPILPTSTPAHSSLQPLPLPLPEAQRNLEMQRIREEIIMREIVRRRVVEEEVRRELIMEQALAMHRMAGQVSFQSLDQMQYPTTQLLIAGPTSFNSPPDPIKHKEEENEKIIILPKPERNNLGEKRKAAETEPLPNLSNKKVKEEWFCQVCKVTTTSEITFNYHIQGKKHRAKERKFINEEKKLKIEGVEKEETSEKKKFKYWCEICKIGTQSVIVMETHKKGKKHKACLLRLGTATIAPLPLKLRQR